MPGKRRERTGSIAPPRLPKTEPVADLPDEHLVDHGIYSSLVLSHGALSGQVARGVTFEEVRFERVGLGGTRLAASHLRDVRFDTCDLAEADWPKVELTRVEVVESRLLGFKAIEARIQDATFRGCAATYALFFAATFKRVRFEQCALGEASFRDANLSGVVFDRCDLREADMQGAKLAGADFRGSRVEGLKVGLADLRGAVIDPAQAVAFAQLLGLVVTWDE